MTLPGALDIEYNPYGAECYGLSLSAMRTWVSSFVNQYHAKTGRWAVVYTTTDWWTTCNGNYSGFWAGSGSRTFMRGIQKTDARGIATFRTVYPGWYPGRSVHIHVKVHVRGNVVHTGQLFFSDTLTDRVYRNAPYSKRPSRTTRNANDSIFVNGGRKSILNLRRRSAGGYLGKITMGVHRS